MSRFSQLIASLVAQLLYKEPAVVRRGTGDTVVEQVPATIRAQLGVLFNSWLGLLLTSLPWFRHYQLRVSEQLGRRYDSPDSQKDIKAFVEDYAVRLDELDKPLEEYATLNEFFARKLRPGTRPIDDPLNDAVAVQPADARVVVFPAVQRAQKLWVKARRFTLRELLGEQLPGSQHAVVIARLAPDDYHRFHAPVAGRVESITALGRELFSVKACAINSRVNVLCENKRVVLRVATPLFGAVWVVAVGAAQVGSVQLSVRPGERVCKGQELGWFQYGGSSVVLVFDCSRVRLDADLVGSSERRLETLVRMGTSLGRAV